MRKSLLIPALLILAGCKIAMQQRMDESAETYRACISARGSAACEAERIVYEKATAQWSATGSGLLGMGGPDRSPTSQHWMQNMGGRSYQCNNIGGSVNCN